MTAGRARVALHLCRRAGRRFALLVLCCLALAGLGASCGPTPAPTPPPSRTPSPTPAAPRPALVTATTAAPLPSPTHTARPAPAPSATATPPLTPTPAATPTRLPPTATPSATRTAAPTATPTPTLHTFPTPPPTNTPPPSPAVALYRTTVSIPTYPYAGHVTPVRAAAYNMTIPRLQWDVFSASAQAAATRPYALVVMENEYLRLSILPELGGRIYEIVFKPTGHNILYRNPVIKPTRWGHETQGWWLAAGGIEWCLPVEEHGYEWGVPWQYSLSQTSEQASVTVSNAQAGQSERLAARVTISLAAGRSYVTVTPRLDNPTSQPIRYQFWLNAMLALGGANRATEATEFILPAREVTVHSTGDRTLPQEAQIMSWPVYNGRALNLYGTWRAFLGVFERPRAQKGFVGAYDHASGEGVLRIYPPDVAPGSKLFAGKGLDPNQWTDDGSTYFELHGGVTPTFWDYATLAPGATISWSERWYPYTAIGPATAANERAALSLTRVQAGYQIGVAVTQRLSGRLILSSGGQDAWSKAATLAPDQPFVETLATNIGGARLRLEDEQGRVIIATDEPR